MRLTEQPELWTAYLKMFISFKLNQGGSDR